MQYSLKRAAAYISFAVIATIFNILTQDILSYLYNGRFDVFISIFIGTAIGLVIKFILDKRYIFKYHNNKLKKNSQVFVLYTVMGIITTAVFWGFEFGFHYLFATKEMRYLGAIIGLMIGYVCKYYLDKRYVFTQV